MRRSLTLTGLLLLFVFGLAHASKAKAATMSAKAARVVKVALKQRGVRYHWGGTSPRTGFDCSGFTRWVYAHVGVSLPHSSYAQFTMGRLVERITPHLITLRVMSVAKERGSTHGA